MFTGVIDTGIGALDRIVAYKKEEVLAAQAKTSAHELKEVAQTQTPPKGFATALNAKASSGKNALICEIKRRSPSAGDILMDADPIQIAKDYEMSGAACLSILTDGPSFGGSLKDIEAIREMTALPILRKDFVISAHQITEARAAGADCVLLIMSILDPSFANELAVMARELGMDVLLETHTEAEVAQGLSVPHTLLGINNRDLRVMKTDLSTTARLSAMVPPDHPAPIVSESGMHNPQDIIRLRETGARRFLIGESLMKSPNRMGLLGELIDAGFI